MTILNSMMWLALGMNVATAIQARRNAKKAEAMLDEAQALQDRTLVLSQFTVEFGQCENADDIIDLQQRWHERLKEVGLDFNDIVKFDMQ